MTIDKQIENLKKIGNVRFLFWIRIGCIFLSVVLSLVGLVKGYYGFYISSVVMVLLALLVTHARPHILNACRAIEGGNKVTGIAEISVESPLDSDRYYAELFPNSCPAWKIEFIPLGWRPVRGQINVDMLFIADVEWPVLIIGAHGIFYPRYKPSKFDKS